MSGIRIQGDWSRLEGNLQRLSRLNFTALHKEIGEHLVSSSRERFRTETAPDGTRWPQSIRARAEGGRTLTDTALLKNSISYRARPDRVEVGTNDKRAHTHQEGIEIRARHKKYLKFKIGNSWVSVKKVRIPKREFIGISEDDQAAINEIIADHLRELIR